MKKSSILALTLVALLAACSKNAGGNTIFDKARARKVSSNTKQEVITRHDDIRIDTTFLMESSDYTFESGDWQLTYSSLYRLDHRFMFSTHKETPHMIFMMKSHGASEETFSVIYEIAAVEGILQFAGMSPGEPYELNARKLYNKMFDSVFSWKTSFFAGCSYFMSFDPKYDQLPSKALNVFSNAMSIIEVPEDNEGYFSIAKGEGAVGYQIGGASFTLSEYKIDYKNYIINDYMLDYKIEVTNGEQKHVIHYAVESFEIAFNDIH